MAEDHKSLFEFFEVYIPKLGSAVNQYDESSDPTLDLEEIEAPSDHHHHHHHHHAHHITSTPVVQRQHHPPPSPALEELEVLVGEFKKKNNYSKKLSDVMLKGLKKTLGDFTYGLFQRGMLPKNWLPIVKMNNDNTPYVEFIIKSDVADQDPASQLSGFSMNCIVLSKYILDCLYENATKATGPASNQKNQIACTAANQTDQPNRNNVTTTLNDSRRILPPRACKSAPRLGAGGQESRLRHR